ncbi:unnamed protein product, partial [Laminaria digitata]
VDNRVEWSIRRRNCNNCSRYYVLSQFELTQGQHWYHWMHDNNDDFRAESKVKTTAPYYSEHYHNVARCHDYRTRNINTSSLSGGCKIGAGGTKLYCTELPYKGPDPSNIYTAYSWGGDGSGTYNCSD